MEFRLLGPLELVVDGAVHTFPAGAEGELFALLLLSAGRVVPAGTLVDALWGDDPPAHAANALQGRVSRLRRALARTGLPDDLVATRRPGYVVDVDPDRVDAHRFVTLVSRARRTADAHSYDEALALWRGAPVAGFADREWARAETTRLTEVWLGAREERIELDLAAGRYTGAVPALEELAAAHPLRERVHGQLMRALYGAGRQADALEVYRRLRRTLADELGLDPSLELRDLERSIIQQTIATTAPPPTRSIPGRLTSFVGRAAEVREVRDLLDRHRLLTLTGPGGSGKTSLAVEAAGALADRFTDGTWFVGLAGLPDGGQVAGAVADALGVPDSDAPVTDRIAAHLRGRAALVLLDNCEHVVDAAATLAERLLLACPRLRLLATSREALAVPGEVQLAVRPLETPPEDAADVARYDAVRLFVDRATAALPAFALTPATADVVARVCRQLDGIPLAIELAAARVRTLPVDEIAARLDDRFRLLTGGPRTAEARQRTLRATVDWSHRLLAEPDRVLFRRLSVFRGGFTLDAAERVCDRPVMDGLTRLVDRSLVVTDHTAGTRFRMLETLRQYASERLHEAGEAAATGRRHAEHFTDVAVRGEAGLRGPDQARWLNWLATEAGNLRAAVTWCHRNAAGHGDLGLRLVGSLGWFWYFAAAERRVTGTESAAGSGEVSDVDGPDAVAAMLDAAPHASPPARAVALLALSVVSRPRSCLVHPSEASDRAARQSLELFERLGDTHRAAMSRTMVAVQAVGDADVADALSTLDGTDAEFARHGDDWGRALVRFVRLELHSALGELDEATVHAGRALALFRRLDDHWGVSAVLYHHGLALHRAGRHTESVPVYEEALVEAARIDQPNTVQYVLANLGYVHALLGDTDAARRRLDASLAIVHRLGTTESPLARLCAATLARGAGDLDAAERGYRDALDRVTALETHDWAATATSGLGFVAELSGDPDGAERLHRRAWRLAQDAGRVGTGAAAAAAEGLAGVAAARGDRSRAAALLAAAERWRATHGRPASAVERADADRAAARLGPDAGEADAIELPDLMG
ncbi:BTAD domain-containing putative transcriptional regulator [Virgisporangium ochraceum]|uniref:BTAD domain-containing putative transcriptional regulator n=1 Tax=Virgisporangium ochraceum TaxID=65505 RepID=UPI001941AFF5|nr:BTAD domain-containing putative transcriptional regulator [Virgisporangium ochraceum]